MPSSGVTYSAQTLDENVGLNPDSEEQMNKVDEDRASARLTAVL